MNKILLAVSITIFIYVLGAFSAPIAMKLGYDSFGERLYSVYELFCHQRVERSLFLFGDNNLYSVGQLREEGFIPKEPGIGYPEYFGHGYNGNSKVGFKVAICIRDIAFYTVFALSCLILSFGILKKRSQKIWLYFLILPMLIDVALQYFFTIFKVETISLLYINNIDKRIVTGVLAGIGFALWLDYLIKSSLTKSSEN